MNMKIIAGLAFLLNTLLFATSYAVSKGTLERIDPIVFSFFVMMALAPAALCILAFSWRRITREVVKSGFLLGSCLFLGLSTIYIALKYNSATSTAFYPSLNGFFAAFVVWLFLRQPINRATWLAGIVSVGGAALLIVNSPMGGARGALIAFIGGLICTFYVFLADREQRDKTAYWPLFGIELLTMAVWASLAALLFGDWQTVHPALPNDLGAILYIAFGTIFLPTLITVLLQKYISPVTVSFIYILEPVLGAIVANIYLQEVLPLNGYLGGGLIVVGAVIHTWGVSAAPIGEPGRRQSQVDQRLRTSRLVALGYPLLCFGAGLFLVYRLGGFPPLAWRELYHLGPQLPAYLRQGDQTTLLLLGQAISWLIAWGALTIMGLLATYRACERVLFTSKAALPVEQREMRRVVPSVVARARNVAPSPVWSPTPEGTEPEPGLTLDASLLDVRALRRMGVTPATRRTSSLSAPLAALPGADEARRFEGTRAQQIVERRRRGRRARLSRVEFVE